MRSVLDPAERIPATQVAVRAPTVPALLVTAPGPGSAVPAWMLRMILMVSVSLLAACGTPCTRVAAAEAAADDKGATCNASRQAWSSSKVQTCERNLAYCTENDLKQLELYAKCLDGLGRCGEGQRSSWEIARGACALENIAFKVQVACLRDLEAPAGMG